MLTLERFKELADSYGAALQRWPEAARGDAEALLRRSAEARQMLADAHILDEAIAAASARIDAEAWAPGEQDAALARLRSGVAARIAALPDHRSSRARLPRWTALLRLVWPPAMTPGRFGLATGGGIAILAGLLIGAMDVSAPEPANVLTMLQPAPFEIATD